VVVQVQFGLLGPLYARSGQAVIGIPAARQRVVLAALAVRAGQVVSVAELARVIWDDAPPAKAPVAVRNYVCRLRQHLGLASGRVVTCAPGYRLEAGDDDVDLLAFTRLCRDAGPAMRGGAWQWTWDALSEALALWRGTPLADVPSRVLYDAQVPVLESLRLQACEWRLEAGLHLGRHSELVPELQGLVRQHPLREVFRAQLMLALYRCDRQGEALATYVSARGALVAELGVEPGPVLQELHQRILAADPGLLAGLPPAGSPSVRPAESGAPAAPRWSVPHELPVSPRHFAGRKRELSTLDQLLTEVHEPPGTVMISVIGGIPGVGKTALAVRWAHRAAEQFPDGQLYVNLRGFDPSSQPAAPGQAVRDFLHGLGVPPERIPASTEAQAALYRTMTAGKRLLILLDNARDADQVRPLLPASPGCLVLVTSRNQLAGLAATEGAQLLTLGLLTEGEARDLLALRLGADRLRDEPDAAAKLVWLCGQLPLALTVAAARALARPWMPLAAAVAELTGAISRLGALETGDPATNVRTVFSCSYQNLDDLPARMFRLLGVHPGPDITVAAAAALLAVEQIDTRTVLDALAMANLLEERVPGRFALHDLLRAYARELACTLDSEDKRQAALTRLFDYYLHTSYAAAMLLDPSRERITLAPPHPRVTPSRLASSQQALAWFEAEHRVLSSAVTMAAQTGFDNYAWQLAWALDDFLNWRGHWQDWAAAQRTALAAATRLDDMAGQATARRLLAHTFARFGDYGQARAQLAHCLGLYQQLGDRVGEGRVHQTLGWVAERQNRHADALSHAKRALALYQAADDPARQAAALNNVGWCHALLGAPKEAQAFCRQALALHRQLGYRPGEAASWDSLGYAEQRLGNLGEAANCYRRALGIARELGDRYQEAEFLSHLGDAHHTAGDPAHARDDWQQALDILEDLHHSDAAQVRAKLQPPGPSSRDLTDTAPK
jgi:DNA-binding SARP family transcriptional activator/tetratricopeptide (TPR) repeat protein